MSRERHTGTRSLCNRQGARSALQASPRPPQERGAKAWGRAGPGGDLGRSWSGPLPLEGEGRRSRDRTVSIWPPEHSPWAGIPGHPPHPPSGGRGWESPAPPVYSLCGVAVDTTAMLWGAIPEVPGGGCPDSGIGWPMAPRPPIPPRAWPGPRAGRPRPAAPAAGPPVRLCSAFMGSAGHRACVSGQCALTWARKPS